MKQFIKIMSIILLGVFMNQRGYSYDFEVDGIYYGFNTSTQSAYVTSGNKKYFGNIVIPESITYNGRLLDVLAIGSKAFFDCKDLVSVSIPRSVTSIEGGAFQGCTALSTINLPDALTEVSGSTFENCSNLISIVLPDKISRIGYNAFKGCTKLESIHIPNNTNKIQEYAFSDCNSLKAIVIPGSVTELHDWSFRNCTGLKTIVLEDSDKELGSGGGLYDRNRAFWGTSPHYIYIGRNIIDNLFYGNGDNEGINFNNLSTISIGPLVNSVIISNVQLWSSLKTIYCLSYNPESVEVGFGTNTYVNAKLYVPTGTKEKYMSASGWKNFFMIEEMNVDNMWQGNGEPENVGNAKSYCEKPTISYANGKLTFICNTENSECVASITDADIKTHFGNEIFLTATYTISVYATAVGYENSEVSTATLCWTGADPKIEGIENGVAQVRANAVLIQSYEGTLNIAGVADGTDIAVYSVSGQMVGSAKAFGGHSTITTNLRSGDVAIVRIGEKSVKVVIQ